MGRGQRRVGILAASHVNIAWRLSSVKSCRNAPGRWRWLGSRLPLRTLKQRSAASCRKTLARRSQTSQPWWYRAETVLQMRETVVDLLTQACDVRRDNGNHGGVEAEVRAPTPAILRGPVQRPRPDERAIGRGPLRGRGACSAVAWRPDLESMYPTCWCVWRRALLSARKERPARAAAHS